MPSLQRPTLGEITSRPSRFLIAPVMAAIFAMGQANAADTLDTACKTTAECQAQVAKIQGWSKGKPPAPWQSRKTRSTGSAVSTWHRPW